MMLCVRRMQSKVCLFLSMLMLLPFLPPGGYASADVVEPYFHETFEGTVNQWDGAAWTKETDTALGSTAGKLFASGTTFPTSRAKPSAWTNYEATNAEYDYTFKARYTDEASGAPKYFRTMFRYNTASTANNHYYFEFRQAGNVVYFGKYVNGVDTRLGTAFTINDKLTAFNYSSWHEYKVKVKGDIFQLYIDGALIAESPADSAHAIGTIGFGLKNATLYVDDIQVVPYKQMNPAISIAHTPIVSAYYNTDAAGSFSVTNATYGLGLTATLAYRCGAETAYTSMPLAKSGEEYPFVIPGTNRYSSIGYYISVVQEDGQSVRYPATGEAAITVKPVPHFFTNFDSDTPGSLPLDWAARGAQPNIQVYDDNGNHVLRFFNTKTGDNWTAKFVNPLFRNIDNFKVKFRAKYKLVNPDPNEAYNLWRLRYRATDTEYNSMEWSTHNAKYLMMKRSALGVYMNGSYYRSLLDEWHTYEVEVSGVTHRLSIDGEEVIKFDDFTGDAPKKGYLAFNTVNGLDLMIDDFEIVPLPADYIFYTQPAGNFVGIYEQGEAAGIDVTLVGGQANQSYKVTYTVSKADGDKAIVGQGERTFEAAAYAEWNETLPFLPLAIGTYDIKVELAVNGTPVPDRSKTMRMAVIREAADNGELDLDDESTFGFNVNYDFTWHEDMLKSVAEMGVKHARKGITWSAMDAGTGFYDYSETDRLVNKFAQYGIDLIPIFGVTHNSAYDPTGVVDTSEGLQALGRFAGDLATHYKGKIRKWEMPNEPELEMRPYIPQEVIQVQKHLYVPMKQADLDAVLLAGDHTSSAALYMPEELELGSYHYADAYSYHRYTYGVMPDGFIQNQTAQVKKLIDDLGGWKNYYVTESGWPTALSGYPSVSQEVQRDYAVRGFLIDKITDQMSALEHFVWNDSGFDDQFYNTSFGVTDGLGRPKLAYAALNTLMTTLDQALYVGRINTGDESIEAHVFLNGSEPVVAAWKKVNYGDTPVSQAPTSLVAFPTYGSNGSIALIDVNGNETGVTPSGGAIQVTIGGSPVYLKGFSLKLVYESSRTLLEQKKDEVVGKLAAAGVDSAEFAPIHGELMQSLQAELPEAKAQGIEQAVADIYGLMGDIADRVSAGSLNRNKAYVALEALYNYAERGAMPLIAVKQEQHLSSVQLDYALQLGTEGTTDPQTARYAYDAKIGAFGLMPVSTQAIMRANRYGRIAEESAASSEWAKGYVYNRLAKQFAGVVKKIVASEEVRSTEIMASATPLYGEIDSGMSKAVTVSLHNRTASAKTATLKLVLPEGWESEQTQPMETDVSVDAGSAVDHLYDIRVPGTTQKGVYYAKIYVLLDGKEVDMIKVKLTVIDAVGVRILPVTSPIQELSAVTVRVSGTSRDPKSGQIVLRGPDGQLLQPVVPNGDRFTIQPGETQDIPFHWTYNKHRPFNEYVCDLQVFEETNNRLIFSDSEASLDFLLVQKARTALNIDGDLADWIDAFPIHLRGASRNAQGVYDKNNLDANLYLKWDEDHLYLSVKVKDNIHKASEPASGVWKNDSIQAAIDPLNDKGGTYRPDDIDFGLALNDFGQQLGYVFAAAPPNRTGDISGSIPYRIIRDEASQTTVYEVSIPGDSIVKQLQDRLVLGNSIGFNLVVADSDLQEGRQNYVQWTGGIAESKNPGLYDSFLLTDTAFQLDVTPPVTTATVEGQLKNGWYASQARLTLQATDDSSVVKATYYRVDDESNWHVYVEPIVLSQEGAHNVGYYSEDGAGNAETIRTLPIRLDLTGPSVTQTVYRRTNGYADIGFTIVDLLSGVASSVVKRDGVVVANPLRLDVLLMLPGKYTFTVDAVDRAGNRTVKSFVFEVKVTIDTFRQIITRAYEKKWVVNAAELQSVISRLEYALEKEKNRNKLRITLNAIKQYVQAKSGTKIHPTVAKLLIANIDSLLSTL